MNQIQQKQQHLSITPLLPIVFMAIALFLAINGPTDWIHLWNQLYNPPADARHAIRAGTGRPSKLSSQIRIQQLKEHAMGIAKALDDNVRNEKNRLALVRKIYNGIGLDDERARKVAYLLAGMNMSNVKGYFTKLQKFANEQLTSNQTMYAQFIDRSTQFVDNLLKVPK